MSEMAHRAFLFTVILSVLHDTVYVVYVLTNMELYNSYVSLVEMITVSCSAAYGTALDQQIYIPSERDSNLHMSDAKLLLLDFLVFW